jgi:hypothetical protein
MKLAINKLGLLVSLLFCFLASNFAFSANTLLTPPWYLLQKQLHAILNGDPCVKVDDLSGEGLDMVIKVNVCNDKKALALAAFINKHYEFGDQLAVTVSVYGPNFVPVQENLPTSIEDAADLLSRALTGNKYFVKTGMGKSPTAQPAVYAIFKPLVVQYHSDDIGDWYLNTNEVAAKIFSDVFNLHPYDETAIKIFATTAQINNN